MNKKKIIFVGTITIAHALVSVGIMVFTFGKQMGRFDSLEPASLSERMLRALSEILFLPLFSVVVRVPFLSKFFAGLLGYVPILLNSLIWGISIWYLYSWLTCKKEYETNAV